MPCHAVIPRGSQLTVRGQFCVPISKLKGSLPSRPIHSSRCGQLYLVSPSLLLSTVPTCPTRLRPVVVRCGGSVFGSLDRPRLVDRNPGTPLNKRIAKGAGWIFYLYHPRACHLRLVVFVFHDLTTAFLIPSSASSHSNGTATTTTTHLVSPQALSD